MKEEEKIKEEKIKNENELKTKSRKTTNKKAIISKKDNNEFINEDIIPSAELQLGKAFPEEYKKELVESKSNKKLSYVFNTIVDFLQDELTGKSEQEVNDEAVKMFTYMKLGQRAFWSGVNGKKDRKALYTEISKEYNDAFNKIGNLIDKGSDVDELRKTIKPGRKPRGSINIYVDENVADEPVIENNAEEGSEIAEERTKIVEERTKSVEVRSKSIEPENKAGVEDILEEYKVPDDDIGAQINNQTQKNSKLEQVIQHQKEYIANQELLIGKKKEYADLLEEANKKKEIISRNEDTLRKQGTRIEELEKELFADKGEK